MARFELRQAGPPLGAAILTLLLNSGCLSGGGSGGGSGGSAGGGVTLTTTQASIGAATVPSSTPTVEEVDPKENSTGAVITTLIKALFDRDMDATTINENTFIVTGPNGNVSGAVTCDNPCRTATFDPTDSLDAQESYTATLDETIRDLSGTPLASDFTWTFETAADMIRASIDANGIEGINNSRNAATDNSGRFIAFDSSADNLVAGDANAALDVFVKDTQTGDIERSSVNASGIEGDGNSTNPAISADGRFVAFESGATNLVSGLGQFIPIHVYVKDRNTGEVTLVSADDSGDPANGNSINASISADGRYVAFQSTATDLVTLPANTAGIHVYVKDLETGAIILASADSSAVAGDADSTRAAISADGEFVAFQSASTIFGADGGLQTQIFRKDLVTEELLLVSATDSDVLGDGVSANATISEDGQFVAFESDADNLGADNFIQIVRKDTEATSNSLLIASADDVNGDPAENNSFAPSISDDGRYVAFQSVAEDFIGFTNGRIQIYVKDLDSGQAGPIALISRNEQTLPDALADQDSVLPAITRDGGYVAFDSAAQNLVTNDLNAVSDAFRGLNGTFSE